MRCKRYWPNASYTVNCESGTCKQGRCATEQFLPGTFSVGEFDKGVGGTHRSYLKQQQGKWRICGGSRLCSTSGNVYTINVVTVDATGIIAQLDSLKEAADLYGFAVHQLEFGNELFLSKYAVDFPDAHAYMLKVKPALVHARKLFAAVKLAVAAAYGFCDFDPSNQRSGEVNRYSTWNRQLSTYATLFDAVTIHDYSACTRSVVAKGNTEEHTHAQKWSVLAAWGEVALNKQTIWIKSFFGDAVEIWMTEWGYTSW